MTCHMLGNVTASLHDTTRVGKGDCTTRHIGKGDDRMTRHVSPRPGRVQGCAHVTARGVSAAISSAWRWSGPRLRALDGSTLVSWNLPTWHRSSGPWTRLWWVGLMSNVWSLWSHHGKCSSPIGIVPPNQAQTINSLCPCRKYGSCLNVWSWSS